MTTSTRAPRPAVAVAVGGFHTTTSVTRSGAHVALAGELDLATAPDVQRAVAALLTSRAGPGPGGGVCPSDRDDAGRERCGGEELGPRAVPVGLRIVLDLSALTFVDVVGLDALVRASHRAHAAGASLVVTGQRPMANRLMEVAGVLPLLRGERGAREPDAD